MKKKNEEKVPLSDWAKKEIKTKKSDYFFGEKLFGWLSVTFGIILFLMLVGKVPTMPGGNVVPKKLYISGIVTCALIWLLCFLSKYIFKRAKWKKKQDGIFVQNEMDYHQSLRLKPILDNICSVSVSDFSVMEKEITGTWRPFRVEHFLSDSIRSQIFGQAKFNLFSLKSTVRGISRSVATPNLLDSSSVLFLKDNEGKTLRVLIPSSRTTKEMIIGAMEGWFSDILEHTHTRVALKQCSFSEENVVTPISHPQLIDSLNSSCELTFEQRPIVCVIGQKIQEGVVIATALEVGGRKNIFLPTGFFKQLADSVSFVVQNVLSAPTAIGAIRTA